MLALSNQQKTAICQAADCKQIVGIAPMQSLWAGQGELARLSLLRDGDQATSETTRSLVVKQIAFSAGGDHPRGWNTTLSQQRKRRSYEVELHWYRQYATAEVTFGRIPYMPGLIYSESSEQGMLLVLEDLGTDYPVRFTSGKEDRPSDTQIDSAIRWLAQLYARFFSNGGEQLWPVGGYWHLDTRPDELNAMPEGDLKNAARWLDRQLQSCRFQTLIHGDAKLANFCFDASGEQAAAVDFQYVGKGPGVKDLMLLLSSVMPDQRLLHEAPTLIDDYFEQLSAALQDYQPDIDPSEVEAEWRPLYAVAWADFYRFLAGWSPGHWKIGSYCEQQTDLALNMLEQIKS